MKTITRVALALGVVALLAIVIHNDVRSIVNLLGQAGAWLLLLVPLHCLPLALDVMGWRVLIPERTAFTTLFTIAAVREAINRLLPVANIGGEVVGARLLANRGVGYPMAIGSILVETLLNILSQVVFLVLGLACLLQVTGHFESTGVVMMAVAAAAILVALQFWILRSGLFFRGVHRLAGRKFGALEEVDSATRKITAAHAQLLKSIAWQVSGLISGAAETWLVLRWLGFEVSVEGAIALESFTLAARSVFFIVPAGLGVQEAGLAGAGSLLGIGSDVAVALSLAKRAREIVFGLLSLALSGHLAHPTRTPAATHHGR
jgi:putative membrane protein